MLDQFLLLFLFSLPVLALARHLGKKKVFFLLPAALCFFLSQAWQSSLGQESKTDSYEAALAMANVPPHPLVGRQLDGLGSGYRVVAVGGKSVQSAQELEKELSGAKTKVLSLWWKGRLEKIVWDFSFLSPGESPLEKLGIFRSHSLAMGSGVNALADSFLSAEFLEQSGRLKSVEAFSARHFYFLSFSENPLLALRVPHKIIFLLSRGEWEKLKTEFSLYREARFLLPFGAPLSDRGIIFRLLSLPNTFTNALYSWRYIPWRWQELPTHVWSWKFMLGLLALQFFLVVIFPFQILCIPLALGAFGLSISCIALIVSWPAW